MEGLQRHIAVNEFGINTGIEIVGAVRNGRRLPERGLTVIYPVARHRQKVQAIALIEACLEHHVELHVNLIVARHEPSGDHPVRIRRGEEHLQGVRAGLHDGGIGGDAVAAVIGNLLPQA